MYARHGAISIFLVVLLFGMPAAAQDAPYAPEKSSIDDLIMVETFDEAPLAFPWERVSEQRTADGTRMDFELIYDIDYNTVFETLVDAYGEADDVVTVEPHALEYTDIEALRPMGRQLDERGGRAIIGHPEVAASFIVDIEPDGNRTRIVIQNLMRTRYFSGFVPARVDFRPIDADPIPFRWN